MSSIFRLKQFTIRQEKSALKVGTDSTLLGAFVAQLHLRDVSKILDVGTGTGIIALMLAQKYTSASIDAVEIDLLSAEEAHENFHASPWSHRLTSYYEDFIQFNPPNKYQIIVSNPPYFTETHHNESDRQTLAKHMQSLLPESFFQRCDALLADEHSSIITIIATTALERFVLAASLSQLYPTTHTFIHPRKESQPNRVITIWQRHNSTPTIHHLNILIGDGRHDYSPECTQLLSPYLTILP